ncbi:transcriptional regulator [Staphylococcus nepalensis]|uniref:helix-turn-helix domain-containing protein n=1 Tax=Staphylococcus TaxID=1279 RepID=UPI000BC35D99|nr:MULTISPECIES: XRE family transcriptional regulator [Staphylococcus]ATH60707.1 transcriptional regulator [Staphylococcus nepalensis]ATH65754.1 transcriptional regulator [Staphylococcus nepalensis]AWI44840.1 transcriptional regulator [Staphylococcus nepalensis]NWN84291.1 helix-turn-helix transcriptional regulator [Staphylococcus sp.]
MSAFSNNLSYLMNKHDIDDTKLGELVDVNRTTITRWRTGIRSPKLEKLPEIASVFNVTPIDLLKDNMSKVSNENIITQINEVSSKLEEKRQKRVLAYAEHHYSVQQQGESIIYLQSYKDSKTEEVTVNGYVSAGTGETLVDDIEFTVNYPAGVVPPHDFALQVNGDSMEPLFEHKEIIFVEENTSINSGQLGVFVVDGEAYVKKVFIYQDHIRLVSLNPKYGDMNFYGDSDVRFAGRVIL